MPNPMTLAMLAITPLWSVDVGDTSEAGYSSPCVTENRIHITGNVGEVHVVFCFDADGKPVWTFSGGKAWTDMFPGTRGTPILDDGKLYDESPYGEIVCLDAETGLFAPCSVRQPVLHEDRRAVILFRNQKRSATAER